MRKRDINNKNIEENNDNEYKYFINKNDQVLNINLVIIC